MRIPMTAREQLELARAYGHELYVHEGTRIFCSCGYKSTTRRSRAALNSTMVWHLGQAIADGMDTRNGMMRAAAGARSAEPRHDLDQDQVSEGNDDPNAPAPAPTSPAPSRRVG